MFPPRLFSLTLSASLITSVLGAAPSHELGRPLEASKTLLAIPQAPRPLGAAGISVDTTDRDAVVAFWNTVHQASEGVDAQWTGDVGSCTAGTTSIAYLDATLLHINFYRAMTGLPGDIVFDPTLNAKCQEAALMMLAEGSLSHSPPTSWACRTDDGVEAAGRSNLALGAHGPGAIDLYMQDPGGGNTPVGHRRWILFPPQTTMGSGSTTGANGFFFGSNALWVLDIASRGPRPPTPEWVAWPPPGFVPHQVVYPRWSFSMPDASFTDATVTMTQGGSPVSLTVVSSSSPAFGDPTIVWEPSGMPPGPPSADTTHSVLIENVSVSGTPRSFSYDVTIIDPAAPTGPDTEDIVNHLLGLGPDMGNFDVNGDNAVNASDVVRNVLEGR